MSENTPREKWEQEIAQLRQALQVANESRQQLALLSERIVQINQVCQELNTIKLDAIAKTATTKIPYLVHARFCSLYLFDSDQQELRLIDHNHAGELEQTVSLDQAGHSVMAHALELKRMFYTDDIDRYQKENGLNFDPAHTKKYATRSCICVPLMSGKIVVGALNLADRSDGEAFDQVNDVPIVEQLSYGVTMALRNCSLFEQVQKQARTDALTKLVNYRAFYEQLSQEVIRAERYKRPLTLLMVDIDNFKLINDSFGHPAGDAVLRQMGQLLIDSLRRVDTAARYGGDEMAVLLPETPAEGAYTVGDRIRITVGSHTFKHRDQVIPVSISIGVTTLEPGMSMTEFVEHADAALYHAKIEGKGQTRVFRTKKKENEADGQD